jgi:hypothetical protein
VGHCLYFAFDGLGVLGISVTFSLLLRRVLIIMFSYFSFTLLDIGYLFNLFTK